WLSARDDAGRRRLDDANDYVRIEIATALRRGIRVIPVLVQGAPMPRSEELPADIVALSRRNAIEIADARRFRQDAAHLSDALRRIFGSRGSQDEASSPQGAAARGFDPGSAPPEPADDVAEAEDVNQVTHAEPEHTDAPLSGRGAAVAQPPPRAVSARVIGIDLGTTNSVVAVRDGGETRVIPNRHGNRLTPSVVAFADSGDVLVGEPARRQLVTNPRYSFYSVKRLIGCRSEDLDEATRAFPFQLIETAGDFVSVDVRGTPYLPAQISAFVLRELKRAAEDFLGETLARAVITVPAYFNDAQRNATRAAGTIAGLDVVRIINEPTAAAIAYGLDRSFEGRVAVYDLGGGTFDVSILHVAEGVFEVVSTTGDMRLGGDDFDRALAAGVAEDFARAEGIDLRTDPAAWLRLLEAAELAKRELSTARQSEINLPYITADARGVKHLRAAVEREDFEQRIGPLLERTRACCRRAIQDARLKPQDIDEVILVGGSTRIPRVRELVAEVFERPVNVGVNPDEAVAVGAAIQASVLAGDLKDVLLLDVTAHSLGIETLGGILTTLIERNTTVPTQKRRTFTTTADQQGSVKIHVLEGERPLAADNRTLGRFRLTGIPPAPKGVPKIDVSFDIDASGILHVAARDQQTGREQSIRVETASGLSSAEVERLQSEMKAHTRFD
ncbi:MAG TPA: molecular chaperone DnaK, partial [Planctomycetaceae bacterium]|nr:molecular chaperone DnaK [Planctomycetaceae bacterium]